MRFWSVGGMVGTVMELGGFITEPKQRNNAQNEIATVSRKS